MDNSVTNVAECVNNFASKNDSTNELEMQL